MKNNIDELINAAPKKDKYERESGIEANLVAKVKEAGGIAYKFTSPSRRSVPDRLCIMPQGIAFFVECKAPGQKPTAGQLREHEKLRALGHIVFVLDSKDLTEINNWLYPRIQKAAGRRASKIIIDELERAKR